MSKELQIKKNTQVCALLVLSIFLLCTAKVNAAVVINNPHLRVGGVAQWYLPSGGDKFQINHQSYFRRAKLFALGKINAYFSYMAEYDFSYHGNWQNVWLNFRRGVNDIRLGQSKVPFNNIYNQSSSYLWFAAYALPARAFNPGLRRGLTYHFVQAKWNFGVSVFAPGSQVQNKVNKPYGATQRLLVIPINKKGETLQLGLSNWYQNTNNNNRVVYRSVPEASGYTPVSTVNTGPITGVSHIDTAVIDGLFQYRQFASLAGFFYNRTPRSHQGTLHFYGWYAQASWFLTPNTLRYNPIWGTLGAPEKMRHAYQLVARLSGLNLNDHSVHGGDETNATIGFNVYWLKHIKVGVDYIYANVANSSTRVNGHDNIMMFTVQTMF